MWNQSSGEDKRDTRQPIKEENNDGKVKVKGKEEESCKKMNAQGW